MIKNNYPFGSTIVRNFNKGDLVWWTEWRVENKILTRNKRIGVFLKQKIKLIGNRELAYADVLCSISGDSICILAVRLKKEETI